MLIKSGSGGGWGDLAANLPTAVNAAGALPKPKIHHEVCPFTRESLEKIHTRGYERLCKSRLKDS